MWLSIAFLVLTLGGCCKDQITVQADDPELAAWIELMLPTDVEIQRYLTKPVSFAGTGDPDGIELILAAYDTSGDLTRIVGTLQVELEQRRLPDRIGRRVAFWPIEVGTPESNQRYWDPLARFYRFPLQLQSPPLEPGQYVIRTWLHVPGKANHLLSEYAFTYDGEPVPPSR